MRYAPSQVPVYVMLVATISRRIHATFAVILRHDVTRSFNVVAAVYNVDDGVPYTD